MGHRVMAGGGCSRCRTAGVRRRQVVAVGGSARARANLSSHPTPNSPLQLAAATPSAWLPSLLHGPRMQLPLPDCRTGAWAWHACGLWELSRY